MLDDDIRHTFIYKLGSLLELSEEVKVGPTLRQSEVHHHIAMASDTILCFHFNDDVLRQITVMDRDRSSRSKRSRF